jgi:hypothetical protein
VKSKLFITALGILAASAYAQPSGPAGGMSPPVNRPEVSREVAPSMPRPAGGPQPGASATGGTGGNGGNGGLLVGNGGAGGEGVAKPSIVAPSPSEINARIPPLPPLPPTSIPAVKLTNPRTGEVASEIKASGEGGIKAAAEGVPTSQINARPPLPDSQAGDSGLSLNDKKDSQSVGSTEGVESFLLRSYMVLH